MKKQSLRLQDIAEKIGFSSATLSLVLNNKGTLSQATRVAVKKALAENGYVYNKRAAAMRTRKTYDIGVLLQDITNPYFSEVVAGLSEYISGTSYLYFLANADENPEKQDKLLQAYIESDLAGMILYLSNNQPEVIDKLQNFNKPIVLLYRDLGCRDFDYITSDYYAGSKLAATELLKAGHKKIMFAGGQENSPNRQKRVAGILDALRENNLPEENLFNYYSTAGNRREGFLFAEQLADNRRGITAVHCCNDVFALGLVNGLLKHDIVPGRDMAVIGYDNIREAELSIPALSTILVNPFSIGFQAAEMLLQKIEKPELPVRRIISKPEFIKRET